MENGVRTYTYVENGVSYYVAFIHPINAAVLHAAESFHGRDWRRIKREMNKAYADARVKYRSRGTD